MSIRIMARIMQIACAVEKQAEPDDVRAMFKDLKNETDRYYQSIRSKFDKYGDAIDPKEQWLSNFFAEIDFLSVDLGKNEYDREACLMRIETMIDLLNDGQK